MKKQCFNCSHEEVCAIKPIVEEMGERVKKAGLEIVHPHLEIAIECRKFLKAEVIGRGYVGNLGLSVRSENILKRAGIRTKDQFLALSERDLVAMRSMGQKSLHEIMAKQDEIREKQEEGKQDE